MFLRDDAVEKSGRTQDSGAVVLATQAALDNAKQTLVKAMGQPTTAAASSPFRKLLDQAELLLKTATDSAATFAQLKLDLRRAEEKVLQESRKIDRNLADAAAWGNTWKLAVAKAHLNETLSAAELDTVESVRTTATCYR